MITDRGKSFIKRYLANQSGALVGAMSVGIGNAPVVSTDERMQFEFARVPVIVTDYDFTNDELIFKSTLPEEVGGTIYEIGLWTDEVNSGPGNQESRLLTSFDSDTEDWSVETFATGNTRIGDDSLILTPAASGTSTSVLTGISLDLVDFTSLDTFILAYYVGNANAANVTIRLRTDSSNYYEFTITNPTAGYKFASFQKGMANVVGSPEWFDINEIEVSTTAGAGGAASVQFDGLRIEDVDSLSPEYGLIARFVLQSSIVKAEGTVQDIEYALPVNIS